MRTFSALLMVVALAAHSSASSVEESATTPSPTWETGSVTYFDRNHDGIVDYEFHDLGCCDQDWGLVDTDYDGRYDARLLGGYAFSKRPVDIAVPTNVSISKFDPSTNGRLATARFDR